MKAVMVLVLLVVVAVAAADVVTSQNGAGRVPLTSAPSNVNLKPQDPVAKPAYNPAISSPNSKPVIVGQGQKVY